ncbi:MAG: bifunctional biotin--[acetyl-CoA-carboxylase] ligase/biotin operon repressor BirA [Gammaproteobacteria bacterium]|nr:bifunctional biotin--[acetyl-CoA-carboxylase] ligase/biotin operon repressor BirA [Gammaproteobacteria bacterium]
MMPPMQTESTLLNLLADGETHSGAQLARDLGVSRNAIWKRIRTMTDKGLGIRAVPGAGYRLDAPLELLSRSAILDALPAGSPARKADLVILDEVDSTNDFLLRSAGSEHRGDRICMAEYQTGGRGRQGRTWHSPFGRNIYLSISRAVELGPDAMSGIGLAAATAIVKTLEACGLDGAGLKWPNDILYRGRKLAGLLIEFHGEHHGRSRLVIGAGVNVAMDEDAGRHIDQPWTDLCTVLGGMPERNPLAARLIHELTLMVDTFTHDGLKPFLESWAGYDLTRDKTVRVESPWRTLSGIARGIDDRGALLVETGDGIQHVLSGDVRLRQEQPETMND